MYFQKEEIAKLKQLYLDADKKNQFLLEAYIRKNFQNINADEYAKHGLARRIRTLKRCIDNIYVICPPDKKEKPSSEELIDLAINLQAFVFNTFGCLDNLAWIWVKEKKIKDSMGKDLSPHQIGLGKKYSLVRQSLSENLRNHLISLDEWFYYLEGFRHALAHRIPLYVSPYVMNEEEATGKEELEKLRYESLTEGKYGEYQRLTDSLKGLGKFVPLMSHSFEEKSQQIMFHPQVITDWQIIIDLSEKFLEELTGP